MVAIQAESMVMKSFLNPYYMGMVWRIEFVVRLWRCEAVRMGGGNLDGVVDFGDEVIRLAFAARSRARFTQWAILAVD